MDDNPKERLRNLWVLTMVNEGLVPILARGSAVGIALISAADKHR